MSPIPIFHAYSDAATEAAALTVLRSGQIASGPRVSEFQHALRDWTGLPHVVTTSDMSSAMMLALHVLGVGPGDEVLTPAFTCMSSAAPIVNLGAQARWVDVEPNTGLLNPEALVGLIRPRTKACVVYHLAGYPARMQEIAAICRRHNVAVIEDCNSALGSLLDGQRLGSWADAAIYSFYPNRQINGIEGGAAAFRSVECAERALALRRFGIPTTGFRDPNGEINAACDVAEVGWSAAMNQLNSAVALAQLEKLQSRIDAARTNAETLHSRLSQVEGVTPIEPTLGTTLSPWALLTLMEHRDRVLIELKARGVMVSKLHHRIDSYTGFGTGGSLLLGTSHFLDRILALPCGHWLSELQLRQIVDAVKQAVANPQT